MDAVQPAVADVSLVHVQDRYTWYASLARLAPSKHNSQPWRFGISEAALEVWADPSRRLPATDPTGRETVLACGAAVQVAVVAARVLGAELSVRAWPDGPSGPVARLVEAGARTPTEADRRLLDAIRTRRTDRGPLDIRALPASLPFVLHDLAAQHGCALRMVRSEGDRRALARVVDLADRQLVRLPEVSMELRQWTRVPGDDRPDGVPATATRGPRSSYSGAFVQRDFSMPQVEASHDRDGEDHPLVVVLCTPQDLPVSWLQGGRALMALLLETSAAGGSASYLNQPLELPGMRDLLSNDLDLSGHPQAVLRIGAGGQVPAPPRRPLEEVLLPPTA